MLLVSDGTLGGWEAGRLEQNAAGTAFPRTARRVRSSARRGTAGWVTENTPVGPSRWSHCNCFTYAIAWSCTMIQKQDLGRAVIPGGGEACESRDWERLVRWMECVRRRGSPKWNRNEKCLLGDGRMESYLRGSPFNWAATFFSNLTLH